MASVLARIDLGRQLTWPRRLLGAPPLVDGLERGLQESLAKELLILPNLEHYSSLVVLSDYAGEVEHHRHYTYSFFVGGFPSGDFVEAMGRLRPLLIVPGQVQPCEIGFKNLGFGPLQRALPEYLATLDQHLHGLLCTVAVPKSAVGLICQGAENARAERGELARIAELLGIKGWKPKPLERMCRIVHVQAFLLALLSVPGQRVFWMTDADAIAATPAKFRQTATVLYSVLSDLYGVDHFQKLGIATPFGHDRLSLLDALSAADLAAGVWAHGLAERPLTGQHEQLLKWLSEPGAGLNKIMVLLEPHRSDNASLNVRVMAARDRGPPFDQSRSPRRYQPPMLPDFMRASGSGIDEQK